MQKHKGGHYLLKWFTQHAELQSQKPEPSWAEYPMLENHQTHTRSPESTARIIKTIWACNKIKQEIGWRKKLSQKNRTQNWLQKELNPKKKFLITLIFY